MSIFGRIAGGTTPATSSDPLWMNPMPFWDLSQMRNGNGRTRVGVHEWVTDGVTVRPPRTLTLIVAGQSNHANSSDSEYTPTNAGVLNLSIFDGQLYRAKDPLLGCSAGLSVTGQGFVGGNVAGRLGDRIIDAGYAERVVLVTIAVDASSIQNWAPNRTPPIANLTHRWDVTKRRLDMLGLTADAILWHQGETDAAQAGVTSALYVQWMGEMAAYCRALGLTCPWFVCQATHPYTTNATAIRAGQAATVDGVYFFSGPDTDTIGSAGRQVDDTHFNASGNDTFGRLWMTSLAAYGVPFRSDGVELEDASGRWQYDDNAAIVWS
jgi:hypothetical protein